MTERLDGAALRTLFTAARSHNVWLDRPVSDDLLVEIYNLAKMGPTRQIVRLRASYSCARPMVRKAATSSRRSHVEKTMKAP